MPTSIDNVRLRDDAGRPTAYTVDYSPGPKIAAGVALLAFCLVGAVLLVRMVRRYRRPVGSAGVAPANSDDRPGELASASEQGRPEVVDLLTSYSNRGDVLYDLQEALRQLGQASTDDLPPSVRSVRSPDRKGQVWALTDRLSDEDRRQIVASYEAGDLRKDIAERYGISVSSVARILQSARIGTAQ